MTMQLAQNGCTVYRIVMSHPANETIKLAADALHDFLYQITGASLPVMTEWTPRVGPEILVGASGRLAARNVTLSVQALGEEGYVMRTVGEDLVLAGATPRGTLYAVYAFLEEQMGCRWFSAQVSRIPHQTCVALPMLDVTDHPAFESREAYWRDAFDGCFAVRNRMNGNKADISIRQGGRMKFYNFHHSFDELVPPQTYFASHPEYFSLVDGKRLGEQTQLCLTNPDVLALCIERVQHWLAENPDCRVFSVAQNDWDHHCQCPACRAMEEAEESPAGPMIWFVNQVAEALEKVRPEVLIHTFAYQYTRKAPKHVRPRPNVIVRLCTIACCFSHPLDGELRHPTAWTADASTRPHPQCACVGETKFRDDLQAWSKICDRLYVWDYVTNFNNYLMPFPNLDVLQANLQFFARLGVRGVLEQGDYAHGGGGNLAELQAYLQAKLLWNPECDLEAHLQDFLAGYYGRGSADVRAYLALWQEAVRPYHMTLFEGVDAPFVTDALLQASDALLNHALFVETDSAVRERLQRLQLGITYLTLSRLPLAVPGRDLLIDRFGWQLRSLGIAEIHERRSLEESLARMKQNRFCAVRDGMTRVDYKM